MRKIKNRKKRDETKTVTKSRLGGEPFLHRLLLEKCFNFGCRCWSVTYFFLIIIAIEQHCHFCFHLPGTTIIIPFRLHITLKMFVPNPYKRAKFIDDESTGAAGSLSLSDLHEQMVEFVHSAVDNFTENNPHMYELMTLTDDERAMDKLQRILQEQKQFVDQAVTMYLDVIMPSISNPAFVVLASNFAASVYEIKLQSILQNIDMCPHSPTSSTSSCSEKTCSDSDSVGFVSIDLPVEPPHMTTPVKMPEISPFSLKSYAYRMDASFAAKSLPFDHEDTEVANLLNFDEYDAMRNVHSPLHSVPSPFSLLAGSVVDMHAAVTSA